MLTNQRIVWLMLVGAAICTVLAAVVGCAKEDSCKTNKEYIYQNTRVDCSPDGYRRYSKVYQGHVDVIYATPYWYVRYPNGTQDVLQYQGQCVGVAQ